MNKRSAIAFCLGTIAFPCFGASPLCTDLASFTCAPRTQDDGTGLATTPDIFSSFKMLESIKDAKENIQKDFLAAIENPDNALFRATALEGTHQDGSPDCRSKDPQRIKKCNDLISQGLFNIYTQNKINNMYREPQPDLTSLDLIKSHHVFKQIEKKYDDKIVLARNNSTLLDHLEKVTFVKVKDNLIKKIVQLPLEDSVKTKMQDRIRGITFNRSECSLMGKGVAIAFVPNAYYDAISQTFSVCAGLFDQASSEFFYAFVIAHELSHSIDPCSFGMGPESMGVKYKDSPTLKDLDTQYPLPSLLGCLRSSESLKATNFVASPPQSPYGGGYSYLAATPQYGSPPPPRKITFCDGLDQATEAIADWLGGEAVVPVIAEQFPKLTEDQWQVGFSNIFRPLCIGMTNLADTHSPVDLRVNAAILPNPAIREKMGCKDVPSPKKYCDPTHPEELAAFVTNAKVYPEKIETVEVPVKRDESPQNGDSNNGAR